MRINGPIAGLLAGVMSAALNSAAAGRPQDCSDLTPPGDSTAAIRCVQPLAQAGDAKAELLLGERYNIVNEATYDAEKSASWLTKAAEHGEIAAQVMVGDLYREGNGVPKDLTEAMRWYRAAADRGDQRAQFFMGMMYLKGWGTPKDMVQAINWERKAADQHGPLGTTAEASIAGIYLEGDGVPKDYAEAARWFRRAAEHGDPSAYFSLAQMDEKGLGGPPDLIEAYVGYSIALAWLQDQHVSDQVTGMVTEHRDIVAARLTDAQRTKATRLVREHTVGAH